MKRLKLSICIVMFFGISLFSCERSKVRTASLLGQSAFSKKDKAYILVENDSFIVSTTFQKLYTVFKPWLSPKNHIDEDIELYNAIIKHQADQPVYVNRLASPWKYEERLSFKIADLFESGNCLVFNKMTQQVESNITIKEYYLEAECNGRKFYVGNIAIFKTIDIIY